MLRALIVVAVVLAGARVEAAPVRQVGKCARTAAGARPAAGSQPGAGSHPAGSRPRTPPSWPSWLQLSAGAATGGAMFLSPLHGPVDETTAHVSVTTFARLRLPNVSWRTVELYAVWPHGVGLDIKNDDLHLGRVRLHLLDVGLFFAVASPVTVQRVDRRWDATFGLGAEIEFPDGLTLTIDHRLFTPLDVFGVVAEHGDAARLIGEEILKGGQTWLGASYRWW